MQRVGQDEAVAERGYLRSGDAARSAEMSPLLFSRLSSSVTVELSKDLHVEIGACVSGSRLPRSRARLALFARARGGGGGVSTAVQSELFRAAPLSLPGLGMKFARRGLYVVGFTRQTQRM